MATVIICPSCGTRYEIAAVIPPEGRKVRCSKCSHIWQARPIPPMPVAPVAAPPPREEPPPPPPPPAPEMADFASYAPEPQVEPSFSTSFEEVPPAAPEEEKGFYPAASNGRDNFSYESYAQQDAEFDAAGEMAPDQPTDGGAAMGAEAPAEDDAAMFGEWESAAPAQAPAAAEVAPAPIKESGRGTRMGWLLLILFLLGLTGFVLMAPKAVVSMLPGATRLYAALGMPINSTGLAFQGVNYGFHQEGEETVLEVKGDIVNLTDAAIKPPVVVVVLLDENGKELSQYTTVAKEEPLGAGEAAPFLAEIASPPAEVRKLKVRFARAQ